MWSFGASLRSLTSRSRLAWLHVGLLLSYVRVHLASVLRCASGNAWQRLTSSGNCQNGSLRPSATIEAWNTTPPTVRAGAGIRRTARQGVDDGRHHGDP